MSYDTSLFDHDPEYYEFLPNNWLPGKIIPGSSSAWPQKAIDAAVTMDLKDTDVIIATYPKTGKYFYYKIYTKLATKIFGIFHNMLSSRMTSESDI